MSQENVDTLMRSNEAFNRGDYQSAWAGYDPDVEFRDLNHPPDSPEAVRGIGAMEDVLAQWRQSFPDLTATVEDLVDAGDAVVLVTRWRGKGTGSGIAVDTLAAEVYEFADGRIVRVTMGYESRDEALQAVGLAE